MKISAQSGQHLVKKCKQLRIGTLTPNQQMVQPSVKEVEVPYYYYYLLPFLLKLHPNGIRWLLKQGLSRRWLIQIDSPVPLRSVFAARWQSLETWAVLHLCQFGWKENPTNGRDGQITDRHHVCLFNVCIFLLASTRHVLLPFYDFITAKTHIMITLIVQLC